MLGDRVVVEHLVNTARGVHLRHRAGAGGGRGRARPRSACCAREPGLAAAVRAAGRRARHACSPARGLAAVTHPDAAVVSVPASATRRPRSRPPPGCATHGVRVGCFRPPSVPDGVSRLRLTARADLTDADLHTLARPWPTAALTAPDHGHNRDGVTGVTSPTSQALTAAPAVSHGQEPDRLAASMRRRSTSPAPPTRRRPTAPAARWPGPAARRRAAPAAGASAPDAWRRGLCASARVRRSGSGCPRERARRWTAPPGRGRPAVARQTRPGRRRSASRSATSTPTAASAAHVHRPRGHRRAAPEVDAHALALPAESASCSRPSSRCSVPTRGSPRRPASSTRGTDRGSRRRAEPVDHRPHL